MLLLQAISWHQNCHLISCLFVDLIKTPILIKQPNETGASKTWTSLNISLRAHLHDTTVLYNCSFWRIRVSLKSLQDQLQHTRANSKQELCFYNIIAYAKVKNRIVWKGFKRCIYSKQFVDTFKHFLFNLLSFSPVRSGRIHKLQKKIHGNV